MSEDAGFLPAINGETLSPEHRALLRPGELVETDDGKTHRLPRFFYVIANWPQAHATMLAPHFKLSELMTVDSLEAGLLLREFPHYVPCAIQILAGYLEAFRRETGAVVFVSTNGGYRSPAHRRNKQLNLHSWGTAADIYRVGDTWLNDSKAIARYGEVVESLGPQVRVRPYREGDDHLHFDLGFVTVTPHGCAET